MPQLGDARCDGLSDAWPERRRKRRAEERVTLAQLMGTDPRHPWEVVLDATHVMDVIVRDFQAQLLAGETITADQLDRLINVNQVRHHMATTAINTKAADKVAVAVTQHLELQGKLVGAAIVAVIDALGLTDPWRAYALEGWQPRAGRRRGAGARAQAAGGARRQERDVSPRSGVVADAPAIEAAPSSGPCLLTTDDLTTLADDALKVLGRAVLAEFDRRDLDG